MIFFVLTLQKNQEDYTVSTYKMSKMRPFDDEICGPFAGFVRDTAHVFTLTILIYVNSFEKSFPDWH